MNCVQCEEVITNPLCPVCLQKGVQQWLGDEHNDVLSREVSLMTDNALGETPCIRCGSPMGLCVYCYTKDVFDLVKRYPVLLRSYLSYFNFDLHHLGWEREAREILAIHGYAP